MLDTGTTAFMILSTSLVMLMTPGLAFFYGGLASKRNILGIMIQTFVSLGLTTILWISFGYSLCFSGGQGALSLATLMRLFCIIFLLTRCFRAEGTSIRRLSSLLIK